MTSPSLPFPHLGDLAAVSKHYVGMEAWVTWMQSQVDKTGLNNLYSNYGEPSPPCVIP